MNWNARLDDSRRGAVTRKPTDSSGRVDKSDSRGSQDTSDVVASCREAYIDEGGVACERPRWKARKERAKHSIPGDRAATFGPFISSFRPTGATCCFPTFRGLMNLDKASKRRSWWYRAKWEMRVFLIVNDNPRQDFSVGLWYFSVLIIFLISVTYKRHWFFLT